MSKLDSGATLVEFAIQTPHSEIPRRVRDISVGLIADCLGATLAGIDTDVARTVREYAILVGGSPEAQLVGDTERLPAALAAMVTGTTAHALDLDDDEPLLFIGHPSAPVLSALLALAESVSASGEELVSAFAVGVEVEFAFGRLLNPHHYNSGFHATSSIGVLGAVLAAARLARLDVNQGTNALGIAASHIAGIKRNFGTMTKPLHVGRAAEAAVVAVRLAALGLTSAHAVVDGPGGLVDMFSDATEDDVSAALELLAAPYGVLEPGVTTKQYPSCSNTHPAVDAMLSIMADIKSAEIATIECRVAPGATNQLQYSRPATGLQGKFSMEYCLGVAAVHGAPWIEHFDDAAVQDPEVRGIMGRVRIVEDASLVVSELGATTAATVVVTDIRGVQHDRTVRSPRGSRSAPLTDDELRDKFKRCALPVLGDRADSIFDLILALDGPAKASELISAINHR